MKQYLLIPILVLLSIVSFAQVLVQDAQGKTSVLYHGNAVNFDFGQTRATFAYNSFGNEYYKNKSKKGFWGVQASAKSKNGISSLINSGNIVPEGEFSLTYGWTIGSKEREQYGIRIQAIQAMEALAKKNGQLSNNFQTELEAFGKSNPNINANPALQTNIDLFISSIPYDELATKIRSLKSNAAYTGLASDIENLAIGIEERINLFQKVRTQNEKQIDSQWDKIQRSWWKQRGLLYLIAGGIASEFILVKDATTTNFDEYFEEKDFQSLKFGVGYNHQFGGTDIIGANIVIQKANTFAQLEDAEYTLTTTTTNTTQKLEGKKTFTAYTGTYNTFTQTSINTDYVKFFSGFSDEKSVVALNGYLRHQISFDNNVFPTVTNIGGGAYFFKDNGLFLGGIYFEFQDIANNIEAQQETPDFKPFYHRLNFGIVTKFSLNSIIAYNP